MPIDFDAIRDGLGSAVPFNAHLGLEYLYLDDGRAVVRLPDAEHLRNHLGTQHAGGLFSVAEAASGAAFVATFLEHIAQLRPTVRVAEIEYHRPGRGPIDATASLPIGADAAIAEIDDRGEVEFTVAVELADAEQRRVASASVAWNLRRPR